MRAVLMIIASMSLPAIALAKVSDAVSSPGPEAKGVIDVVLQHGITGAMLLIVLYGYYRKDRQLTDEREATNKQLASEREAKDRQLAAESAARVADAKANAEVMRSLVVATTTQMERFNDTAEALVNELRTERHASRPDHTPQPVRRT